MRAFRSDSREWPRRIGVWKDVDGEEVDEEKGLGLGGESKRSKCCCTWARVVVMGARADAVIPDHL